MPVCGLRAQACLPADGADGQPTGLGVQEDTEQDIVDLLQTRLQLARLAGYTSYAHYRIARDGLAKTPEAVQSYLRRLQQSLLSETSDEMTHLEDFARSCGMYGRNEALRACDRSLVQSMCLREEMQEEGLAGFQFKVCALVGARVL